MRHGFKSRTTALLLAVLFVGGAGGVSDLDAFLFHGVGAGTAANATHIETAGNPNCHTEHCALALRLANGRVARTLAVSTRFAGTPAVPSPLPPDAAPHRFFPGFHLQSRAPPASLV
jgi:hypothetical protein